MKITSILCALILGASLVACGGGGGGGGITPAPVLNPIQVELAARLASSHLDNGAWDWRQNSFPYNTTVTGYQNVSGITALGLLCAYDASPDQLQNEEHVLHETKDYLVNVMQDYLDDVITSVSLPNFIYLDKYDDVFGLPAGDWAVAQSSFAKLMLSRDADYGTEPGVISDGIWNRIYAQRAGIPGIRGWDLGFLYKALVAMEWPQNEIDWVFTSLASLDIPTSDFYGEVSIAHVIEICSIHGALPVCALWLPELDALMVNETVGTSISGDHQATAYAILALKAMGQYASDLEAWLESEIGVDGSLIESDGYEYFEIMGEALQAFVK